MQEVNLAQAIEVLKKGGLVIYPTETLYGLGADIENPQAIARLFELKNREANKPISLLVSSLEQIKTVVRILSPLAEKLIKKFFPGPLTLVLPASEQLDPGLHAGTGWIGVRQSSHALAQSLVTQWGRPLTTTSANPSGLASGISILQLKNYFKESNQVFLLSGGDLKASRGSTVIRVDAGHLELLREGEIPFTELLEFS